MGPPREHIELMSLPRRPLVNSLMSGYTGLPLNSLPGWEDIPLNCKLPMLKCPGNEVIFSKNKIGQTFKVGKRGFDLSMSMNDDIPEYNPLHDSNMKSFYTTKENLKRLRRNGEITENNDVICNLKDFNKFRAELHKSNLYLMLQNQTKLELDQKDFKMIARADHIRMRAYGGLWTRIPDVALRKQTIDESRHKRSIDELEKTKDRFVRVQQYKGNESKMHDYKRLLNKLNMERHKNNFVDINRKQLIHLKKVIQWKRERSKKHMRQYYEKREKESKEKRTESWEKRLNERLEQQARIKQLQKEAETSKKIYIDNHMAKLRDMWKRTELQIQERAAKKMKKLRPRKKKNSTKTEKRQSMSMEYSETFEKLLDSEIFEALKASVCIEENPQVPFDPDDPIYKAASFITHRIITQFDRDLRGDKGLCKIITTKFLEYFEDAIQFVQFRASQLIFASRNKTTTMDSFVTTTSKSVAFSNTQSTIGMSSYSIHPLIDVKSVNARKKTPPGSLTSVLLDDVSVQSVFSNLDRYSMVFLEHFTVKFKRKLITGMGRNVFAAVRCASVGKIMDVRKDLLDIDDKYLAEICAKSILGYAKNPLDYQSALIFCTNVLSTRLIWSLQKILLKPERDPRGIVQTNEVCPRKSACTADCPCVYCENCMFDESLEQKCKNDSEENFNDNEGCNEHKRQSMKKPKRKGDFLCCLTCH